MILKLSIILLLAAFIILMAWWVVRNEEKPRKEASFLDPDKSYTRAKELGIKLPNEYKDVLPGV